MKHVLLLFLLLNFTGFLSAQKSVLKLEDFMQGDEFVGHLPDDVSWSPDSKTIYFSWKPIEGSPVRSAWKVINDDDFTHQPLTDEEITERVESGIWNRGKDKMLYLKGGALYLFDKNRGDTKLLYRGAESVRPLAFLNDELGIAFLLQNNVFHFDLKNNSLVQLSDFRSGNKPKTQESGKAETWIEEDNLSLFEVLRERKDKNEYRKNRSERIKDKRPKTIYSGSGRIENVQISKDANYIGYRIHNRTNGQATNVPDYLDMSGYTRDLRGREKVGTGNSDYASYIYDIKHDTIYQIEVSALEGIRQKPEFLRAYHTDSTEYQSEYEKDRTVVIHGPFFSDSGKAYVDIKSLDNKDRWIALLYPETGKLTVLDRQRDEAWIGGPGIYSWNGSAGSGGWLEDGSTIWFQSEETGFSHIYTINTEDGSKTALTSGNFEILNASLSSDGSKFYITSNKESPHEQYFYHLEIVSGEWTRITKDKGGYQTSISPDEKWLAIRYSTSNKPWELYIMSNQSGAAMKKITESRTNQFRSYPWRKPEIIKFKARDGAEVPARIYKPTKSVKKGPAVIFVHGAGYLQNVHEWWSSYFREYMFHNFLADQGYTVLDIDFRASSGYGRDWRTAIYRHMGGADLNDQIDGANYLIKNHGVGKNKIGIYGGSYGGFITLMALFTSPETFQCGAALRSVTDWAHYNHGYTSNILNTPIEDPEAYRRSSPIYFADGLKSELLMLHGVVDVNVQFQDVVRLSQRLIELGKDNWELSVFPVEDHGFVEASSWVDEYKRIFKLFEKNLRNK
jgi:dipeptidyl aminopeptidase/acylaminoacyl peptidase